MILSARSVVTMNRFGARSLEIHCALNRRVPSPHHAFAASHPAPWHRDRIHPIPCPAGRIVPRADPWRELSAKKILNVLDEGPSMADRAPTG